MNEELQKEIDEVLEISKKLIKARSVTPYDDGLIDYIAEYMKEAGFEITIWNLGSTRNLFAKIRNDRNDATMCFAGHIDVVPAGPDWKIDPFKGLIENGIVHGRGTSDMKCAVACAMVALRILHKKYPTLPLSLLLTSDEEGDGEYGLKNIVQKFHIQNERFQFFILGEPSAKEIAGDTLKIGRRGSVVGTITVQGKRGHIAYPEFAYNPIPDAVAIARELIEIDFDDAHNFEEFGSSKLQITEMTARNSAENVIPEEMKIMVGVRFNPNQTFYTVTNRIQTIIDKFPNAKGQWRLSGNPFYLNNKNLLDSIQEKIRRITGIDSITDAKGATSDGRFLHELANVFEIGFVESQAHQINEHVSVAEVIRIYRIYKEIFSGVNN